MYTIRDADRLIAINNDFFTKHELQEAWARVPIATGRVEEVRGDSKPGLIYPCLLVGLYHFEEGCRLAVKECTATTVEGKDGGPECKAIETTRLLRLTAAPPEVRLRATPCLPSLWAVIWEDLHRRLGVTDVPKLPL